MFQAVGGEDLIRASYDFSTGGIFNFKTPDYLKFQFQLDIYTNTYLFILPGGMK